MDKYSEDRYCGVVQTMVDGILCQAIWKPNVGYISVSNVPERGIMKGMKIPADWDTHGLPNKVYDNLKQKVVYRNKRYFKSKFNIAHFPKGTVVEIEIFGKVTEATVLSVSSNGANSWLIEIDRYSPTLNGNEVVNIGYVTRIIKRGAGGLVFRQRSDCDHRSLFFKQNNENRLLDGKNLKHPSQYFALCSHAMLLYYLGTQMTHYMHLIDTDKLMELLEVNGIRTKKIGDEAMFSFNYLQINKKKLKKRLRRMLPHAYIRRYEAQRDYDDQMSDDDWFDRGADDERFALQVIDDSEVSGDLYDRADWDRLLEVTEPGGPLPEVATIELVETLQNVNDQLAEIHSREAGDNQTT